MRTARRVLFTTALSVAVAAGCTDDPRQLEGADLRRLIVRSLEEADTDNALHFTAEQAECMANRVTRAISDERLRALGVDDGFGLSALPFSDDEQDVVFDALLACADPAVQVATIVEADSGLPADRARCVAEGYVADPAFREAIFSDAFDPALNERIDTALAQAAQDCAPS